MPLHEYECDACGHRFEAIQKFSDAPLETCPKCGGHLRKLISAPAFQFKGTGWYVTDYAKKDSVPASRSGESKSGGGANESAGAKDGKESTAAAGKSDAASGSEKPSAPAATKGD